MKTAIGIWDDEDALFCASIEVLDSAEFPRDLETVAEDLRLTFATSCQPTRVLLIDGQVLSDYDVEFDDVDIAEVFHNC